MNTTLSAIIQILFVGAAAPLLPGVINRVKAWFAGRNGPPLLQVYFDLWKLLQRQMVISQTTSWLFVVGPLINFSAVVLAALFVPLGFGNSPLSFSGDLILVIYLMALGRFFTVNAAMDTGSAFEGMGAVREVTYASLVEPTVCIVLLSLAMLTGSFSLSSILLAPLADGQHLPVAALVLLALSWFVALLVEACRIPFDDPNTHLELTMVHEVMVLDHSGPLLGLILWASSMKLLLMSSVFVSIVLPRLAGIENAGWTLYLPALLVSACLVGLVESATCRLRLLTVPKFLLGTALLSVVGMILLVNSLR